MNIEIYYDDRQSFLSITDEFKNTIKKTIEISMLTEKLSDEPQYEISVSFVTNDEIHELNKKYRSVDRETDVLSFPMDLVDETINFENLCDEDVLELGDVVLSTEKIISQAKELGHTEDREISYLVAHSVLHLMGYDHMEDDEKEEMRVREKEIMKELKIFK